MSTVPGNAALAGTDIHAIISALNTQTATTRIARERENRPV
jgi:hypothetical protein